jgi:hypothetical protein
VVEADTVVVLDHEEERESEGLADTVFVALVVALVVLVDLPVAVTTGFGVGDRVTMGLKVAPAVAEDVLDALVVRVDVCDL